MPWGGAGSNTQHAYFQLLHQGNWLIPSDFIAFANSDYPLPGHHDKLLANCLAQAEAPFGNHHDDPLCGLPRQPAVVRALPPDTGGHSVAGRRPRTQGGLRTGGDLGDQPLDQWGRRVA